MEDELLDADAAPGLPPFFSDPHGVALRRWKWMAGAAGFGLFATLALVLLRLDPLYEATATVQITSKGIREAYVPTVTQVDPSEQINAIVGEVVSRARLANLIETHGLYAKMRDSRTLEIAITAMRQQIQITPQLGVDPTQRRDQSARLFLVSFAYEDPEFAARVANDLAHLFTDISIQRSAEQTRVTKEFLERELAKVESELQTHNRRITEFRQRYRGELPEDLETNLRTLERLELQRQSYGEQIASAESRVISISTGASDGASPEVRLRNLQAALAEQASLYTENHPNVMGLRRQIEALKEQIQQGTAPDATTDPLENSSLIAVTQRELLRLRRELAQTEAAISDLDRRVAATPARQEELAGLLGRQQVLDEKHTEFLHKVQDAKMSEDVEVSQLAQRFSVLEEALPPENPVRSPRKYLLLGLLATLLASLATGFALEWLDPVVIHAAQLEKLLQVEVLGAVPRVE